VSGPARERLDKLLVDRGLCESRERAQAVILAGQVFVDDRRLDKAGTRVPADARIELRGKGPAEHGYVSRGGVKLAAGLDAFGLDPGGLCLLDAGASTGGFTDCLQQRGARRVIAVDVGYGQLAWKLRQDARVHVIERANVRELEPSALPELPGAAVADLSFISLTKVLARLRELLGGDAGRGKWLVVLVKPQFEVGRERVGKGGVVRDEADRLAALEAVAAHAREHGLGPRGQVESPIAGPAGNREYLLHLEITALRAPPVKGTIA
jgi:23S rRNA (cytidine1920-2'-O)/16S rRNA (cytidine1409-2'-O)-methyltransferase